MRQLTHVRTRRLEWREAPEPALEGPGEALVRPIAAARCDLDYLLLRYPVSAGLHFGAALGLVDSGVRSCFGRPPFGGPFAVGHECVAEVIRCGADVQRFATGAVVIVPYQISCGQCPSCLRGITSHCMASKKPLATYGFGEGTGSWGGSVSDVVRVPYADHMLVRLPDGIDPAEMASASDNLPDAWRTVGPSLRDSPGASVLVVGGGARSIALYAVAIAKALHAEHVDYVDWDRTRMEIAARLGANVIEPIRGQRFPPSASLPRRYRVSVDASSLERGLELALRSLEPGGICTSVCPYFRSRTPIPLFQMYVDGITLKTGMVNARVHIPDILDLVASGRLTPSLITTLVADWNDADRAFLERTTKVVVTRKAIHAESDAHRARP